MEKETMGTVISVTKQWWLKVNRKPVRAHAMDGAAFPHTIKVKYTIDGKDYICRKWIGAGNKVPDKGTTIKVIYCEDKPSKARIDLSFKLNDYHGMFCGLCGMKHACIFKHLPPQRGKEKNR